MESPQVGNAILNQTFNANFTGFHATTASQFAEGFAKALSLSPDEKLAMRLRARKSAKRFTEEEFAKGWLSALDVMVKAKESKKTK